MTEQWRQDVCNEVARWIGTPYQHKGRVIRVGVDCGGLLYEVYGRFFGPLPPFPDDYAADWAMHRENEIYLSFLEGLVTPVDGPVIGGITMWRVGRNYSHGTICTGFEQWTHAWGRNGFGKVVTSGRSFFETKGATLRMAKHFDLDTKWLLQHP